MNKTTKAKYDLAERMLKGRVDVDEVVMMSGLTKEQVEELKDKVVPKNTDAEILSKLDTVDLDIGPLLYDDAVYTDEANEALEESEE